VYVLPRLTFFPQKALTCFYGFRSKQLSPLYKTLTDWFYSRDGVCLLRITSRIFEYNSS